MTNRGKERKTKRPEVGKKKKKKPWFPRRKIEGDKATF